MRLIALLFVAALAGYSADYLAGPVSGYLLLKDSGSLRVIQGLPGAAILGASVNPSEKLLLRAVSADADIAAGLLDGVPVLVHGLRAGSYRTTNLTGLTSSPDLLAARGQYAAVYSSADRKLLWIENALSAEPVITVVLDGEQVSAVAVNATGRLLAVTTDSSGTTLLQSQRGASLARVAHFNGTVAISFADGENALLADYSRNEVLSLSPSGHLRLVASERDGLNGPVAVAFRNGVTYIANAGSRTLHILEAGQVEVIDLPLTPDRLELVAPDGAWRLNDGAPAVQYLFDPARRSTFFIPAESATNE
ncbi:MAG: hypothetical protein SGI92_00640 [Bryobacteraceae bacterium]|nr:hypothetical protein [Bryobacteraceae bacterium]